MTNERIQRLIETDREALVALMMFAWGDGSMRGGAFDLWSDTDVRSLIEEVRRESKVSTYQALKTWNEWAQSPEQ